MRNTHRALLLRFHKSAIASAILLGAGVGQNAFAQSSATEAIEDDLAEVVVSATRVRDIGLVSNQTAPKSRVTLTGEYLDSQASGQTVFQSLNQIPGVNFTNSDPYGGSGGNLRIRGFDGSRVSVTFDGIPLNDSGNYSLYPNQMLDPELIERVDVAGRRRNSAASRSCRTARTISCAGSCASTRAKWAPGARRRSSPLPTRTTTSSRDPADSRASSSTSWSVRTSRTTTS
jgi:hypothetical protein